MSKVAADTIVQQFNRIQSSSLLDDADTAFIFYDLSVLENRMQKVKEAFGQHAKHTVAIKSNPLSKVLAHIAGTGSGLECASFEEVLLAQRAGARFIAWDSPAKTEREMIASNEVDGLMINADSLKELNALMKHNRQAALSLRINPQMDTGAHASMSVAGNHSKFGEPIANEKEISQAILQADGRVSGIHVHTSSQTKRYDQMSKAIQKVVELAVQINEKRPHTIQTIDIGGGFPAPYSEEENYDISEYVKQLKHDCPQLFDGTFQVVTEFGRYYHANAGWTATRIHDVKRFANGHQVIIGHVGADLFLREAYNPGIWHHDFLIMPTREGEHYTSDVGGPLCFGGDYIAKGIELPRAEPGDWLIVRDTGANSFALWSRHCSRAFPKVIAGHDDPEIIRDRDSFEDILKFWS